MRPESGRHARSEPVDVGSKRDRPPIFGFDPIVALASTGPEVPGFTELGTSVVLLTGRHPMSLAPSALTAQAATNGRFTFGIGPSHEMVAEGEGAASPDDLSRSLSLSLSLVGDEPTVMAGLELDVEAGFTDFGVAADSDDEIAATRRFVEELLAP